jgi:hypothetical protein
VRTSFGSRRARWIKDAAAGAQGQDGHRRRATTVTPTQSVKGIEARLIPSSAPRSWAHGPPWSCLLSRVTSHESETERVSIRRFGRSRRSISIMKTALLAPGHLDSRVHRTHLGPV